MEKNKMLKSTYILILFISGVLLLTLLIDYSRTQQNTFDNIAENTLNETITQQQFGVKKLINTEFSLLKTFGRTMHIAESDDHLTTYLNNLALTTHFQTLFWIGKDKTGITNDGFEVSVQNSTAINRALEGYPFISDPIYSEEKQEIYILVAAPSYTQFGVINGVICGIYTPDTLKSILLSSFTNNGITHIVNSKGQYIASTYLELEYDTDVNAHIDSELNGASFEDGSLETVSNDLESLNSGQMSFSINNEDYQTAYMPLDINDWTLVTTVPLSQLLPSSYTLQERTYYLYLFFMLIFAIGLLLFIRSEERSKKELFKAAYYDALTGLPTFDKFKADAEQIMKNHPNDRFSCIVFDILNFKIINDSFGNHIGDLVLKEVANIATAYMNSRKGEVFLGRLHSDVFIILSKEDPLKDAEVIKVGLINQSRNNASSFRNIKLDFYLGRYISQPSEDIEQVLERAKVAHSHAKRSGVNKYTDYDSTIVEQLHLMNAVLTDFEQALENNEFKLYIQPQFDAKTEKICGAEILVRWIQNGTVKYMPDQFISILEKSNDILRLDAYIREQAFSLIKKWHDEEKAFIPSLSVNVSRLDFLRPDFTDDLVSLTQKYNVDPSKLHLEITETTYVKDHMRMSEIVKQLQSHGFCIEMDDFGSGYSSLNILKDLSLDTIKLDMKFLNDHTNNKNGEIIISSIIKMAQDLNLKVIAEGTETIQQVSYLRDIGCNELQGYYFAKPMPVEEFEQKILNN